MFETVKKKFYLFARTMSCTRPHLYIKQDASLFNTFPPKGYLPTCNLQRTKITDFKRFWRKSLTYIIFHLEKNHIGLWIVCKSLYYDILIIICINFIIIRYKTQVSIRMQDSHITASRQTTFCC